MWLTFSPQIGLKPIAQVDIVICYQNKALCEACNLTLKQGRNKIRQEPVDFPYTLSAAEQTNYKKDGLTSTFNSILLRVLRLFIMS